MPNIKLQSSDLEILEVDVEIAKASLAIKTMLEDLGMDDYDYDQVVSLPEVNSAILKKVIEWATYHRNDSPLLEENYNQRRTVNISSWDADFLKVDTRTLYELFLAANYLGVKILFDVTCKTIADLNMGKEPEEFTKTLIFKPLVKLSRKRKSHVQEPSKT